MIPTRLLKDIARALVIIAHEEGVLDRVMHDLDVVSQPISSRASMLDATTLRKLLDKMVHPFVLHTLLLLQEKYALAHLSRFVSLCRDLAAKNDWYHDAHVTTAQPLSATQRAELERWMATRLSGTIAMHEHQDPSVLGSFVIHLGDQRLDATVKGKLQRLKQTLTSS